VVRAEHGIAAAAHGKISPAHSAHDPELPWNSSAL
jgi:hypothetical protein